MSGRRPSLPPMPDLSHLTEEERKIIESVLQRQREEEEKEQEILRNLQDDFENYQASVKKLSEEGRQVQYGNQGAVCQICHKTKFADGIGHKCHYCGVRSCARCGGKVSLRSAKDLEMAGFKPGQKIQGQQAGDVVQIWACNLCKKKQELLVKTGQWYHGGMAKPVQLDVDTGSDTSSIRADPSPPHEKKPKFYERGAMGESQERMLGPDGGMGGPPPGMMHGGPPGGPHGGPPGGPRGMHHPHPAGVQRAGSMHGKELKRQFSMSEVNKDGGRSGPGPPPGQHPQPPPGGGMPPGMGPHPGMPMDPRGPRHPGGPPGMGRGLPGEQDHSRGPPGRGDMENYPPGPPDGMQGVDLRGRPLYSEGMDPRDLVGGMPGYPPGGIPPDRRLDNERPLMGLGGEMQGEMPLAGEDRMRGGMPRFDGQDPSRRRDDSRPRDPRDPLDRRREDLGDPSLEPRLDDPYAVRDVMGDRQRIGPSGQPDMDRRYPDMPKERYPIEGLPDHQQHVQQPLQQQPQQIQQQQDRQRRGSVGRSRGDRMGHDLDNDRSRGVVEHHDPVAAYGQDPGRPGAAADRHPERLMRGHAPVSPKDVDTYDQYGGANTQPRRGELSSRDHGHHNQHHQQQQHHHRGRDDFHDLDMEMDRYPDQSQRQHLDPSSAVVKTSRSRRKLDSMLRNDSLSSDPSDCVRPPPPKPHKHKKGKNKPRHQASLSSSDDEIQTTPECTSCDEQEIESESVSEKDPLYGSHTDYRYDRDEHWKKDEILAAKIKKFLAHPVTWQPSADGKLIGHMILRKTVEGAAGDSGAVLGKGTLGLKVIGGKMTDQGYLGAFITKVKRGSIADTVGHLRPGDEVVEWNGRSLQGKTFEEVYDIIFESKQEPQVELIVRRSMSVGELPPGINEQDVEAGYEQEPPSQVSRLKRPSVTITSPGSPGTTRIRPHSPQLCGKLQVKMYYDNASYQLIVTVMSAVDLTPRDNGQTRNPYCKLYLLPDRSEKSKRRTKTVAGTLEPRWNQTFIYSPMKRQDLSNRALEITVYDYDRIGSGEYVGEVVIQLSSADFFDEPRWYTLRHHDDSNSSGLRSREGYRRGDAKGHLSPPSSITTTTRLSDSDMSEFDLDDSVVSVAGAGVLGRGDGASVSSLGSSCSPPPGPEDLPEEFKRRALRREYTPSPLNPRRRIQSEGGEADLDRRGQRIPGMPPKLNVPDPAARRAVTSSQGVTETRGQRSRSRSPGRQRKAELSRSLSPPERDAPPGSSRSGRDHTGTSSRSANVTPTSTPSPKKRHLPQIPVHHSSRDRVTQDLEERARLMKMRMATYRQTGSSPGASHASDSEARLRDHQSDRYRDRGRGIDRGHDRGRELERGHHRSRRREFSPEVSDDAIHSDASETSDMSEVSKISTISVRSTQSEKPRRKLSEFASKMESRAGGPAAPGSGRSKKPLNRSLSNSDVAGYEKSDGSMSDSAITSSLTEGRKRRPSLGYKVAALVGLSRRSSSTSQLSATGEDQNDAYYDNYDPSQQDQQYQSAGYDQQAYDRGHNYDQREHSYDRGQKDYDRSHDRGYEYGQRYDRNHEHTSRYDRGHEYEREYEGGYDQRSRSTRGYDDRYDKGRDYERRSRSHDRAYDVERAYERRRDRYQRSRSHDHEDQRSYDRGNGYDQVYDREYDRGSVHDKEHDYSRSRDYERGHETNRGPEQDPRSYSRGHDQSRAADNHSQHQGHDQTHQAKQVTGSAQQYQQQTQLQNTITSSTEEPQVLISQTKHSKLANKLAQQYGLTISPDVQQQYNQVIKSFHAKQDEKQQQSSNYDEVVRTAIEHQKAGKAAISAIAEADPPSAASSAITQLQTSISSVAAAPTGQKEDQPIAQVQAAATGLLSSFKSAIFK